MRSLGWVDHLSIRMSPDRKSLTASYWTYVLLYPARHRITCDNSRPLPAATSRMRNKLPLLGGTLTISIVESSDSISGGPFRSPKARVIAKIQRISKLGNSRPSDEVEGLKFDVRWEPAQGALGVHLPAESLAPPQDALKVVRVP